MAAMLINQKALHQTCLLKSHCEVKDIPEGQLGSGICGTLLPHTPIWNKTNSQTSISSEADENRKTNDVLVPTKTVLIDCAQFVLQGECWDPLSTHSIKTKNCFHLDSGKIWLFIDNKHTVFISFLLSFHLISHVWERERERDLLLAPLICLLFEQHLMEGAGWRRESTSLPQYFPLVCKQHLVSVPSLSPLLLIEQNLVCPSKKWLR